MSTTIRVLRMMAGTRRREADRLETALGAQRSALEARQAEAAAALATRDDTLAQLDRARAARSELVFAPFTPEPLKLRDFLIQDLVAEGRKAEQELNARQAAVRQHEEELARIQRAIRRNDERIASFDQRVADALRSIEQAQEEQAQEESEEAAAGRFIASRRAWEAALR